ncbi:hypothetical protein DK843_18300 [Chromobacterium phragmitis]|uniref:Tyr recombinase domain-containing protein n=2 Tax=Chromobacterium phragmitis TaxID=2202141 RepID=A0A344ULC7_9NEIS|nr:hypothetical protein DK843_18300 [Chromobacterium phragmitis]
MDAFIMTATTRTSNTPNKPPYTYINEHGVYYFQLRLPKDIQALPAEQRRGLPPSIIRKSLKTSSTREAAKRAGAQLAHYTELFEEIRKDCQRATASVTLLKNLTLSEAEAIALKYREATEQVAEALASRGANIEHDGEEWAVSINAAGARALAIQHEIKQTDADLNIDGFLRQKNIDLVDSPSRELAAAMVSKTLHSMLSEDRATAVIERARARETELPVSNQTPLQSLLEQLIARRKPTQKREQVYRAVVENYEAFIKRPAIVPDDFNDRATLEKYRDFILSNNKISSWNNRHAAVLNMLIKLAYDLELIARPFSVHISDNEEKAVRRALALPVHDQSDEVRRAFTDAELERVKALRVYKQHPEYLDFLLYTGMRCTEAAQLMPSDVIEDPRHGLFVRVRDTEGRTVKTAASVRTVPVPSGYLTGYIKSNMDKPYLFPHIAPHGVLPAERAERIIRRFSDQKQRAGFDKQVTLYSFRHTWKLKARAAKVEDYLSDYITGALLHK